MAAALLEAGSVSVRWQRFTLDIPEHLDGAQRLQLADDIIETIKRRTEAGKDKNGKSFPGYSKTYIESLDFKVAGKSPNRIDLTLSGDMLAALQLLGHEDGKLTIGFEPGTEENARADGNIRGAYGGDPNPRKARDFLGIAPKELDKILRHYR